MADQAVTDTSSGKSSGDGGNKPEPLYESVRIYPKSVRGTVRKWKWIAVGVLLAIYYILPWIRWDRGPNAPDQAVLFDFAGRRFYFFDIEIWPQEIYYVTGLLIIAAIGLFLVTSLAGRLWCGFACPQTVWTDLYMWVERKIEGDRNARMRLDKQPWSANKVGRKLAKHAAWLLIAALTGGMLITYFKDAPTLASEFFVGEASFSMYFFAGLITLTTYLLAGWAREQVCTYMCPWPRFQSAMLDENSLVVTYESWRGEPRSRGLKRTSETAGTAKVGDCVDCGQCVQVCPTGVDIREGNQLACIGCGLCIDACNEIMAKLNRPGNLVRWDTQANQDALNAGLPKPRYRLFRPRTIIYFVVLALSIGVMTYVLTNRSQLEVNILRDRNPLFVVEKEGDIRNGYTLKLLNMTAEARTYDVTIEGLADYDMAVVGLDGRSPTATLDVAPDSVGSYKVYVRAMPDELTGTATDITFVVKDTGSDTMVDHDTVFRAPPPGRDL